eukprot:tig00020710_g13352.t1
MVVSAVMVIFKSVGLKCRPPSLPPSLALLARLGLDAPHLNPSCPTPSSSYSPFLPQIVPPFLAVIRSCEPGLRDFMFQQLAVLVSIVKQHIRNCAPSI